MKRIRRKPLNKHCWPNLKKEIIIERRKAREIGGIRIAEVVTLIKRREERQVKVVRERTIRK